VLCREVSDNGVRLAQHEAVINHRRNKSDRIDLQEFIIACRSKTASPVPRLYGMPSSSHTQSTFRTLNEFALPRILSMSRRLQRYFLIERHTIQLRASEPVSRHACCAILR
jgi:hypothetical protein